MHRIQRSAMDGMPNGSMRKVDKRRKFPAFLLTYSQTKMTVDYCYRQLLKLRFDITEVVMERHLGAGFHIHVFLSTQHKKPRRLSPEEATVGGERPNIVGKGVKKILDARMYIRKEYVDARGLQSDFDDSSNKMQRLLHQACLEDALKLWPGVDPSGYIYNHINGEIGLMSHYEKKPKKYVSVFEKGSFILPMEVECWIDEYVFGDVCLRPKSLILWGPTRLGKTQLARSIGEHWYMNWDWDVSQVREDVKYGIVDDMDIKKFPYWKPLLGCQEQFTVADKYHKKKQLSFGKPVIWLCNEDPSTWKGIDLEWIYGNVLVVGVHSKLF